MVFILRLYLILLFQVHCEYTMANFSTGDRVRKPKGDRLFSFICQFSFLSLVSDIFIMVKNLIGFEHECLAA